VDMANLVSLWIQMYDGVFEWSGISLVYHYSVSPIKELW